MAFESFRTASIGSRLALAAVFAAFVPTSADAAVGCSAAPSDAWKASQEAVASGDAGHVMLTLTPAYRTRNAVEYAVGASMVAQIGGMSGSMSDKPGAAEKAKETETKLLAELNGILKKHKAATIEEIGKPLLVRMQAPEVLARFEKIDHAAYAREMEKFLGRVEAAAKEAGVSSQGTPKLDELVVGGGDLKAPLGAPAVTGDTAKAAAGAATMQFRKINGCWLVDGRDEPSH